MAIEKLHNHKVFERLCAATKKWGLCIGFGYNNMHAPEAFEEICKAAPYLSIESDLQILMEGNAIFLCDTEEEMLDLFYQTVGDDGPTSKNSYSGEYKVYALTCSPTGQLLTENT